MFQETWYSPLHATCWLDGDADGRYILFYCFGISKAEEARTDGGVRRRQGDERLLHRQRPQPRRQHDAGGHGALHGRRRGKALGGKVVRTEENAAGSALHEFGGLRMGRDPASSVTDPDGRFWRIGNLNGADAAIWPHQGSANSYLTITAVALRNASRLAITLESEGRAVAAQ